MEKFPLIKLSGDHYQIGYQHGTILKERILRMIQFYKQIFNRSEKEILRTASHYEKVIARFNLDYLEEIRGIAKGAGVDINWILALNARSEILTMFVTECTAVVSPRFGLLAQNWDWAEELEELAVLMHVSYNNGHSFLMMTEPGIIGKIGLNWEGLGVTLNFLHAPGKLDGVPIHIILRALLDSKSLEEGRLIVQQFAGGQGGNIIFASSSKYYNFEFANKDLYETEGTTSHTHTNHYLMDETLNTRGDKLASSFQRYARSMEMIMNQEMNKENIQKLLSDQHDANLPICRPYVYDEEIGKIGTVCHIIMDLNNKTIMYTPGNPFDNSYKTIDLI